MFISISSDDPVSSRDPRCIEVQALRVHRRDALEILLLAKPEFWGHQNFARDLDGFVLRCKIQIPFSQASRRLGCLEFCLKIQNSFSQGHPRGVSVENVTAWNLLDAYFKISKLSRFQAHQISKKDLSFASPAHLPDGWAETARTGAV